MSALKPIPRLTASFFRMHIPLVVCTTWIIERLRPLSLLSRRPAEPAGGRLWIDLSRLCFGSSRPEAGVHHVLGIADIPTSTPSFLFKIMKLKT